MNPKRTVEITEILRKRGLKPVLIYDLRATDLLFKGLIPSIAEFTGQFLVGAECGYDEGLKKIGKGTTTKILEDAAALLHSHGLAGCADFSFVVGLPWESAAEVRKTCQFAAHLFSTYGVRILLEWYCQIPGSRLWEADREAGRVNELMYNNYGFSRPSTSSLRMRLTETKTGNLDMVALQALAKLQYPTDHGGVRSSERSAVLSREVMTRRTDWRAA